MDERYRDSLQRHHSFLMTHILLTDDVIQLLASEKILPETMIKDIQDGDTKEERNKRLLNAVRLRGNKSYKRFRELMYRTGNFFVADLLWDEAEERAELMIDEGELDGKFSTVMNCLHDSQRKKFLHYLDAKVREKALVLAWRERPEDRMESLSAKVVDFNQERGLRDTIATQERKIKDLEGQLQTGSDKQRAMRLEISSMEQQMKTMKKEHLAHLATQSRFHDANIQTITRLKNRLARCTDQVILLDELITSTLDGGGGGGSTGKKKKKKKKPAVGMEEEEGEEEEEEGEEAKLTNLETNVQRLLQEFHHEKDHARAGRKQREDVLNLLNRSFAKDSLVSVVKEVLKHEQKHRALVMRDIQRLSDTLKQVVPSSTLAPPTPVGMPLTEAAVDLTTLDTKHFKSQLALLKAEAEHIQKRFQWKDSEAANLRQELFALKQRFHDYKIISSAHKHPFPQVAAAAAAAAHAQSLCSSCGKSLRPQVNGQSANHPMDYAQTQDFALSTAEGNISQEQEHPPQMEDHVEDLMPEGLSSRRSSIGRSDLDKTVVDVEEYLLLEDGPSIPSDNAPPSLTKPPPTPGGVKEGEEVVEETHGVAASRRGSTPVKPPFSSGKGGGGETRGGEAKSRRDVKTTSALHKTQAKRKMNPK